MLGPIQWLRNCPHRMHGAWRPGIPCKLGGRLQPRTRRSIPAILGWLPLTVPLRSVAQRKTGPNRSGKCHPPQSGGKGLP